MAIPFVRTPEEQFNNLPDYPFAPHYVEVEGLRMHYLDEPGSTGETVLMLHGEPSWSFLYRKMIPGINGAGHRCIAPDLVGFGKSDKPTERAAYTYKSHLDWLSAFIQQLDLTGITLFCQDWGGLPGWLPPTLFYLPEIHLPMSLLTNGKSLASTARSSTSEK